MAMKLYKGKKAADFREAAAFVYRDEGDRGMSPDVARLFDSGGDPQRPLVEDDKSIDAAVSAGYGRDATWEGERWLIPVPETRYDAIPFPRLSFAIRTYLVAAVTVETLRNDYPATLIGPVGKPGKLMLPLAFLQAMLDDDLERFDIVGKDGAHTSWSLPGTKEPLRLPNEFVCKLSDVLSRKSVASWLQSFGSQGKSVAPQVVGSLLGLQFRMAGIQVPLEEERWTPAVVIEALTQMFGLAMAQKMLEAAVPYIKAGMTNQDVIRTILQNRGSKE